MRAAPWLAAAALVASGEAATQAPPAAAVATPVAIVNPGFESRVADGTLPSGWEFVQHAGPRSYEFSLDDKIVHGGKQSLRVDNIGRAPHGMVFQDLPVGELRGRTLRLSAYVRTRDVTGNRYGGGAMLMLQAVAQGSPFADNHMREVAVHGTTEWTRYEVTLTLPPQTERIRVGAMVTGSGSVWLDDFVLEALPAAP